MPKRCNCQLDKLKMIVCIYICFWSSSKIINTGIDKETFCSISLTIKKNKPEAKQKKVFLTCLDTALYDREETFRIKNGVQDAKVGSPSTPLSPSHLHKSHGQQTAAKVRSLIRPAPRRRFSTWLHPPLTSQGKSGLKEARGHKLSPQRATSLSLHRTPENPVPFQSDKRQCVWKSKGGSEGTTAHLIQSTLCRVPVGIHKGKADYTQYSTEFCQR